MTPLAVCNLPSCVPLEPYRVRTDYITVSRRKYRALKTVKPQISRAHQAQVFENPIEVRVVVSSVALNSPMKCSSGPKTPYVLCSCVSFATETSTLRTKTQNG